MKKIILFWIGVFTLCSCYDSGNYDYQTIEEVVRIQVGELEKEYSAITMLPLKIEPEIKGIDNPEDYDYSWYVYGPNIDGTKVIGKNKNLMDTIGLKSGKYTLIYQVKNKQSNVSVYRETELTVMSEFAEGWYVTKDWENETDIDMIRKDGKIYENILKTVNGKGLRGEAVNTTYRSSLYGHILETPEGTKQVNGAALFVISKEDLGIYSGDNLQLYKNFEEAFVDAPAQKRPQCIKHGYMCSYLVNDGKIYELFTVISAIGKFGYHMLGDYKAHDKMFFGCNGGPLLWDEQGGRFVVAPAQASEVAYLVADTVTGAIDINHLNCDLIYMREQDYHPTVGGGLKGVAIFKNKDKEEYYTAKVNEKYSGRKNPLTEFDTLKADKKLGKAKVFGLHNKNSYIYFSDGDNRIWSHSLGNQQEECIYTFPAEEKVSFIGNYTSTEKCLAVLTNNNGTWKLYCFLFVGETGEIQTPYWQLYSGKGNARSVAYRAPGVEYIN